MRELETRTSTGEERWSRRTRMRRGPPMALCSSSSCGAATAAVAALDGLSFAVPAGQVFGFLGPNGAGKTTAMRAVVGVMALDGGEVRWRGAPVDAAGTAQFRLHAGGARPLPRHDRPRAARLPRPPVRYERGRRPATSALRWTDRLGVADKRSAKIETLSQGNQQRVQLAAALVHEPELLILDEPFAGLDPVGVDEMSAVLAERAAAGATVLFSSHQLDLVQDICEAVAIIHRGRLVARGRPRRAAPWRRAAPRRARRRRPRAGGGPAGLAGRGRHRRRHRRHRVLALVTRGGRATRPRRGARRRPGGALRLRAAPAVGRVP